MRKNWYFFKKRFLIASFYIFRYYMYIQKLPPEVSCKKGVFTNFVKFTGKHLCKELQLCINKETLAQVISCEICEISKNTFSTKHIRMTASVYYWQVLVARQVAFNSISKNVYRSWTIIFSQSPNVKSWMILRFF